MKVYLDSNAFARLYLDEDAAERAQVISLFEEYGYVASCAIAYAEVSGVFARYFHQGKLSEAEYSDKMRRFATDWESVEVIDVVPELSILAAQLFKGHSGLRGMDALHLASALALRQSAPIKFLSFDRRLQDVVGKLMPEALDGKGQV
ncbi:Ribonuclease VapC [Deinococcus saxicola]|uniref:type II toxin-antitoxin system VapC family toxin n=1 Tax=Deinococcus saxicola TaxID=249406 RepID=UPI0039F0CD52